MFLKCFSCTFFACRPVTPCRPITPSQETMAHAYAHSDLKSAAAAVWLASPYSQESPSHQLPTVLHWCFSAGLWTEAPMRLPVDVNKQPMIAVWSTPCMLKHPPAFAVLQCVLHQASAVNVQNACSVFYGAFANEITSESYYQTAMLLSLPEIPMQLCR